MLVQFVDEFGLDFKTVSLGVIWALKFYFCFQIHINKNYILYFPLFELMQDVAMGFCKSAVRRNLLLHHHFMLAWLQDETNAQICSCWSEAMSYWNEQSWKCPFEGMIVCKLTWRVSVFSVKNRSSIGIKDVGRGGCYYAGPEGCVQTHRHCCVPMWSGCPCDQFFERTNLHLLKLVTWNYHKMRRSMGATGRLKHLFHVSVALVLDAFHEIPKKCQKKQCCSQACKEGGSFPLRVVENLARWPMPTICWFYRKLDVGLIGSF